MENLDNDTIDFFRTTSLLADPYPYFEHLRSRCPVRQESHYGVVMVTGYDEAAAVYADSKIFSSCNTAGGPFPGFPVPLEGDDVSDLIDSYRDHLPLNQEIMTLDQPRHTAYRSLLMKHLTPRRLSETESVVHLIAERQIDRFISNASCEFTSEFAFPFALLTICALLGVPETDHETFLHEMLGRESVLGRTDAARPDDHFSFLHSRFTSYIEERLRHPRDDVMTSLATMPFPDGSKPELVDAVRLASVLFVAGTGTTAQFLTTAIQLMGDQPDLQDLLRTEPDRIPNFIEETLRFDGPIKGTFRLARRSTTVGSVDVPAGSTVMVINSAANRDPRRFDAPNEFLPHRKNARQHLAFGHGIHLCAGAALARLEGRVGIQHLLNRLGRITISEQHHGPSHARRFEYKPSYILRAVNNLHINFDISSRAR